MAETLIPPLSEYRDYLWLMAESRIPSLSEYRDYLWLVARLQIVSHLQIQLDPSDIVQETLLIAQRVIGQIKGKDEAELAVWLRTGEGKAALAGRLRRILANTLSDAVRKLHHGDGERVQPLEAALKESSGRIESLLAVSELSPGQQASHFEQLLRLAQAVATLPEEQRTSVEMKQLPETSIEPISAQPDRASPATVGLLYRGIKRLRIVFERVISPFQFHTFF